MADHALSFEVNEACREVMELTDINRFQDLETLDVVVGLGVARELIRRSQIVV